MKQLTDDDIIEMIGGDFAPDDTAITHAVRSELHMSRRTVHEMPPPEHITIDFHNHTEEEAWQMLMDAAVSGAKTATIITGASGILKPKFQQWVAESILSPYIVSCTPLNNGSFAVKFKKSN